MVHLEERLANLSPDALAGTLRGIEKESLRVTPDGRLATTPHPAALGAALTHPNITTDFSESQIELITGVHPDADACVQELMEIHQFVYRALGDEMLWASSMPCRLPPDDRIPLGQYGRSCELSREDFQAGRWEETFEAVEHQQMPAAAPSFSGAAEAARYLVRYFELPGPSAD